MLNDLLVLSKNPWIDGAIKVVIGLLLLCFLSPVKIEEGINVPITLQSMLVILVPLFFGWKIGGLAVLGYLVIGGMGYPVFANGASGWNVFTGVSGGFLIGFLFAALLSGFLAEMKWGYKSLAAAGIMVLGQFIILLSGLFWMERVLSEDLNWMLQLEKYFPGLMIKAAIGMLLFVLIERLIRSANKSRQLGNS
ncbi:MAG: biotin transporter BioY [Flavobacteriales bacterium]|nr:biotin transporter BioY [Flavobacteriales bacterium]MDG1781198.1 biotin transporter BioY [Flavobacteriales bacterium]MDG2245829.1 biotin transporter BioY [Flavobacteriales bacterium]